MVVVAVDTMSVIVIVCTTVSVAVAVAVVVPLPFTLTTEYVALLRSMTGVCCSVSAIGSASVWHGRVIAVERRKSVVGKCMMHSQLSYLVLLDKISLESDVVSRVNRQVIRVSLLSCSMSQEVKKNLIVDMDKVNKKMAGRRSYQSGADRWLGVYPALLIGQSFRNRPNEPLPATEISISANRVGER